MKVRSPLSLWLVIVAACHSGPAPDVSSTPMATQVGLPGGGSVRLSQTAEAVGVVSDLAIPPDAAYRHLRVVYADLQLAVNQLDDRSLLIGLQGVKMRRRLGGVAMTRYLECGAKDGEPNAETYDIVLNLGSAITRGSAEGTSRLTTRLSGVASDPLHGGGNQTLCTTTTQLEARILAAVKEKAGLK